MSIVTAREQAVAARSWTRIGAREDAYCDVLDFIADEARLLDEDHYDEWIKLVTDDVEYELPQRTVLFRKEEEKAREGNAKELTGFFFDNRQVLELRVRRQIGIRHALDRDPAPRVRRFYTCLGVWQDDENPSEYHVKSNFQALWQRFERDGQIWLVGQREDILRRTPEGLRLAKRCVYIDNPIYDARFFNMVV